MHPESMHTFGEWLQQWIKIYAPMRCSSRVTIHRYQALANYILDAATMQLGELSRMSLADLNPQNLERGLLSLIAAPGRRREKLSMRTIRHVGAFVRVALGKAWRLDLIGENHMLKVELPNPPHPLTRSLTPDEMRRLQLACRHDWTAGFIEWALATGCRRGELLALEWSDFNPKTRALSITKALEESREGLRIKLPKNNRGRSCTLPLSAIRAFPHLNEKDKPRTGLIFPGPDGQWHSPALVSQIIVRRMRSAGIENASLHTLRHTHATLLLSQGMPIPAVSSRLGHSDSNITLKIYAHAMPPDDQRIADAWDSMMGDLRKKPVGRAGGVKRIRPLRSA